MDYPLTNDERETIVQWTDKDNQISIWTCSPKQVRLLCGDERFTITKQGEYSNGHRWCEATIPVDRWSMKSGCKRTMNLTEEQRQERAMRMRAIQSGREVA